MSEALSESGLVGNRSGGAVDTVRTGIKPCARCHHVHREDITNPQHPATHLIFDAACFDCGCTSSSDEYDRGVVDSPDIGDFRGSRPHFVIFDEVPEWQQRILAHLNDDDKRRQFTAATPSAGGAPDLADVFDECERFRYRRDVDQHPGLGMHQDSRIGGSLQRPQRAERSVRDRIHNLRSDLAKPWPLGGAMAIPGRDPGLGRTAAVWQVRLVALVKSIRLWFGVK